MNLYTIYTEVRNACSIEMVLKWELTLFYQFLNRMVLKMKWHKIGTLLPMTRK